MLAGRVALLAGCAGYHAGSRHTAETVCQAAPSPGTGAGHGEIIAWAHEMRAWASLPCGGCSGVAGAARAGLRSSRTNVAEHLADGVIPGGTDCGGREGAPMRLAEAGITLGVARAREADLEGVSRWRR
ncbi:MAG TPA: hypothetical protein VGI96_27360 [Streptosporangiaceae bacterium]